jgi:hypothetical protein
MKVFKEKKAGIFLKKNGFDVLDGIYIRNESQVKKIKEKVGFPIVMKISGEGIIHKFRAGGVILNIIDENLAKRGIKKFKKIKNFEKIFIQKQTPGKEFLLGIKKTPEFGEVIGFGTGGVNTEKIKDVSFRIPPIDEKEAKKMIYETKISKNITNQEEKELIKNILRLSKLSSKYPKIKELDINPLIKGKVIDARIVWE